MALRERNPLTPGQRGRVDLISETITTNKPEKSLLVKRSKSGGRDAAGSISVRHHGGGNLRRYRLVDFVRTKYDVPGRVATIEYDPFRNAHIALLNYVDGQKSYILAPVGLSVGDSVISSDTDAEIRPGNSLPVRLIPEGTTIHNVELIPGRGGQLARAAGAGIALVAKEGDYAIIKLPSGEERRIHSNCRATIGQVGNLDAKNIKLGKAGRNRHRGIRPTVRGSAMNPCDHPHGGGEGRSPIGRAGPLSKWGKPTLGYKTRKKKKPSDRFILRRRNG
jgi:large subunit ribosomal protein L2